MEGEAENPKKAKREKVAIALTLLALIAAAGTYWETHRMVTHGDVKDRPRLKIISSRASKQDDHFINVLLEIRNDGESGATLTEISSQPLTGTVEENTDNQACYDELRDAKPFIDPGGEDREEPKSARCASGGIAAALYGQGECFGGQDQSDLQRSIQERLRAARIH
jgi:hypothetical protein